jgi:hypothetical protein
MNTRADAEILRHCWQHFVLAAYERLPAADFQALMSEARARRRMEVQQASRPAPAAPQQASMPAPQQEEPKQRASMDQVMALRAKWSGQETHAG